MQGDGNLLSRPVRSRHLRIWHRWCELRGYRARRYQRQEREETNHIKLEEPQSTVALARAALALCILCGTPRPATYMYLPEGTRTYVRSARAARHARARARTSTHYHIKSGRPPRRGAPRRAAPLHGPSAGPSRPPRATGLFFPTVDGPGAVKTPRDTEVEEIVLPTVWRQLTTLGTNSGAWSATRDQTGPPAYGNGRPGDLRRRRNRPGFLNYRGEPAQSSAVTLARGTATAATLLSQHMQVPSGTEHFRRNACSRPRACDV